jgi:prepilin-type processing-associated H-X9-DG protein/prepilin-type N-terminal cleavage/methylation domain-containing protein
MKKRGFAMIEVLVVVGLIAVVLALLLPAIQKARQDARKNQCVNNLKQIGLALHNYHDTFVSFPPGWVSQDGGPGLGLRIGWQSFTLPYMDQAALYNQFNFHVPQQGLSGQPAKIFQTTVKSYRCPVDPVPDLNPLRGDYATSNYTGNFGDEPARLQSLGLGDFWPANVDAPMFSRGIFARNSSVSLTEITDGTSNTFLGGERGYASGAAIWVGVTDNTHEDDSLTDTSHRSRPNAGWTSYSSRHPNGVNMLMCDGSVRFVINKIDSKPAPDMGTFQKLGCKNDNQAVDTF